MAEAGASLFEADVLFLCQRMTHGIRVPLDDMLARLDAALPALEAASRDSDRVVQRIATTTLEALKTRNPLYTSRQGWLRTDIYGNGSYEF